MKHSRNRLTSFRSAFLRIIFGLGIIYLGYSIYGKGENEIFGYYSFLMMIETLLKGLVSVFGGIWSAVILFLLGGILILTGLREIFVR